MAGEPGIKVVFSGDPKPLQEAADKAAAIAKQSTDKIKAVQESAAAANIRNLRDEIVEERRLWLDRTRAAATSTEATVRKEREFQAALHETGRVIEQMSRKAERARLRASVIGGGGGAASGGARGGGLFGAAAVGGAAGAFGISGGTAVGLAALYAAQRTFADYVRVGAAVQDAAERSGMPVEEFQRLAWAAEQTGAKMEQVENAIRNLQNRIASGALAKHDAFRGLTGLLDLQPAAQFDLIARTIATIENPTLRAAAAMEAFGAKNGTALLPMLETLDQLKASAPILTAEMTAAADYMDDTLARFRAAARYFAGGVGAGYFKLFEMAGGKTAVAKAEGLIGAVLGPGFAAPGDSAPGAPSNADAEAAAAAQEARDQEQKRQTEWMEGLYWRHRLAGAEGRLDVGAARAMAMGYGPVAELGGGDVGRGMALIDAEERAAEAALDAETRAKDDAARDAARIAAKEAQDRAQAEREAQRAAEQAARDGLAAKKAADREAAESAREAARQAQERAREAARAVREAVEEARRGFGFELPDNFRTMLGWRSRDRVQVRRDLATDADISGKLDRMKAGERVHFTARERRRLEAWDAAGQGAAVAAAAEAGGGARPGRLRGLGAAARAALDAAARAGAQGGPGGGVPTVAVENLERLIAGVDRVHAEIREGGLV